MEQAFLAKLLLETIKMQILKTILFLKLLSLFMMEGLMMYKSPSTRFSLTLMMYNWRAIETIMFIVTATEKLFIWQTLTKFGVIYSTQYLGFVPRKQPDRYSRFLAKSLKHDIVISPEEAVTLIWDLDLVFDIITKI